ncbi:MAG: hypothetical protein AB1420_01335 [Bacillota bacterium]
MTINNESRIIAKSLHFKYIIIAIIVSLLNSFCYANYSVMLGLAIVEVVLLLKCLISKKYIKYLCYFTIFLSTSMESSTFVGVDVFYGFKNFKIAGVNLGAIFILLILIVLIANGSINKAFKISGNVSKFIKGALLLTVLALFMGLFSLLINDNNVANYMTSITMFIYASYIFVFVAVEIIVIATIIERNGKDTTEIKQALVAIIISLAVTMIMSLMFENYGNRGGLPSLQVSNLVMLLISAVIIHFYKDFVFKERMIIAFSSIVIFILGLIYNTNGKMIIIAMVLPLIIIFMLFRNKKYKTALFIFFIGFFGILLTINLLIPLLNASSPLFAIKLEQATSMLAFWESGWLHNMPDSPKIRIAQFLNVIYEYYEKPWFFLFGKGFMGTIKDHLQMFGNINEFSYSAWELNHRVYYVMHETLNTLFLTNGFFGLIYFLMIFKIILKNFSKSPWLLVGGFWFVLFYSYSLTISIFGATAFIVGLYDIDIDKNEEKSNLVRQLYSLKSKING